mgnify:CR=1 FL=1
MNKHNTHCSQYCKGIENSANSPPLLINTEEENVKNNSTDNKKKKSKKIWLRILITIIILVLGIIGIINVGNIDLDKGKVKLKSASIEKLKSSVIESKGYEEITYPVLYELEKVEGIEERTVIIKGTLTKEENKYARFKEITSNNITSTVSENGRKIEIKIY